MSLDILIGRYMVITQLFHLAFIVLSFGREGSVEMKRALSLFFAAALLVPQALAQSDSQIQADLQKALKNDRFKNVHASVKNGEVDLIGTVEVYDSKVQADQRVHRVKGVTGVRDHIQVAGAEISDQELQKKLVEAISYDRVGYGTTPFNAISVQVQNGVVTLGGHAYGPVDADSAVAVAANTKGVKDVVDDIQEDPLSPMDDRIRFQAFRAIYGFPSLNKYAIDPAKPIRIQVANGHVALYGTVDSQSDKDAAGIRANGVSGVFSVTNNLQVAGSTPKEK
jgi:hyperosmotically inducible protein